MGAGGRRTDRERVLAEIERRGLEGRLERAVDGRIEDIPHDEREDHAQHAAFAVEAAPKSQHEQSKLGVEKASQRLTR